MTTPASSQPAAVTRPAGVRIASILCWVVGIVTVFVALAFGIPAMGTGEGRVFFAVNLAAGGAMCFAAVLIWRQRRLGILVVALAWALPTVVALLNHQSARGSLLLALALLFAGANWKHFR